jgi:5-methylthioadenosine/S-adenosylhomocysteine deaminase
VHLSDSDLKIMQGTAAVAHCPGSNLKLASGVANVTHYRQHGITVALGTDGCSSSNDLDMWPVMRLAGYLIAQNNGPQNSDAESIFRMATIEGAQALGMSSSIGSLEVGKRADIIALNLDSPHLIPIHNLFAQLVFAAGRSDVSDVFVDGEQVVKEYRSTKLDFTQLQREVMTRIAKLQ